MTTSRDLSPAAMQLGIEVAGLGLGWVDYEADTITLDARAAELFELEADVPLSRDVLHSRIHPDDWPAVAERVGDLMNPAEGNVIDVVHRVPQSDGGVLWVNARKQVAFDDAGRPLSGAVAVLDVTQVKEAEERIRLMMGELSHRMKNQLTVVGGIARLVARSTAPEDFLDRFLLQLQSMARNQDVLVRQNGNHAALRDIILEQANVLGVAAEHKLLVEGADVRLKVDAVQFLGMAMHELLVNAIKHGAMSKAGGRVRVNWVVEDDTFNLRWAEEGGPEVTAPTCAGFGSTILQQSTEDALNGKVTMEFAASGLVWEIRCPVADVLAVAEDPQHNRTRWRVAAGLTNREAGSFGEG